MWTGIVSVDFHESSVLQCGNGSYHVAIRHVSWMNVSGALDEFIGLPLYLCQFLWAQFCTSFWVLCYGNRCIHGYHRGCYKYLLTTINLHDNDTYVCISRLRRCHSCKQGTHHNRCLARSCLLCCSHLCSCSGRYPIVPCLANVLRQITIQRAPQRSWQPQYITFNRRATLKLCLHSINTNRTRAWMCQQYGFSVWTISSKPCCRDGYRNWRDNCTCSEKSHS